MATTPATDLIDRASFILQDVTNVRWTRPELLDWLNDGSREVVLHKPNAYVKNVGTALAPGSKQALPFEAVSLLDIPRNTGGPVIREVSREILDAHSPGWHTMTPAVIIKHYMYSLLEPKVFYVYPPASTAQPNPAKVDIVYVASPVDVTEDDHALLDDVYSTALIDYMLYRAYSKDAEYAAQAAQAAAYYGQFTARLGVKISAEGGTLPSTTKK